MDLSKFWERDLQATLMPIATDPFSGARQLAHCIELLQVNLPAWLRFPADWNGWSEQQKRERCWPPEFWALISEGAEPGVYRVSITPDDQDIGEHVLRALHPNTSKTPPPGMPERIRTQLERGWQARRSYGASACFVYVRNEWAEREALVAPFRASIDPLIGLATEAVRRKNAETVAIDTLRDDRYLHTDTLANALQCLRHAAPPVESAVAFPGRIPLVLDPQGTRRDRWHDSRADHAQEQKPADALRLMTAQAIESAQLFDDLRDLASNSRRERGDDSRPPTNDERAGTWFDDPERLVTVEEAATLLTVPPKTVWNWINRKNDLLGHIDKLGGPRSVAMRYRLSDIVARRPKGRT